MKKLLLTTAALGLCAGFAAPAQAVEYCFYGDETNSTAAGSRTLDCEVNGGQHDTTQKDLIYFDTTGTYSMNVSGYVWGSGTDGNFNTVDDSLTQTRSIFERRLNADKGIGLKGGTSTGELDNLTNREFFLIDLGADFQQFTDYEFKFDSVDGGAGGAGEKGKIYTLSEMELNMGTGFGLDTLDFLNMNLILTVDLSQNNTYVPIMPGTLERYLLVFEEFENTADTDDILLSSIRAKAVSAPAALGLFGLTLAGFGFARRQK